MMAESNKIVVCCLNFTFFWRKRKDKNYAECDDEWSGDGEKIQPKIRKPSAQKRKKTTNMKGEKPGSSKKGGSLRHPLPNRNPIRMKHRQRYELYNFFYIPYTTHVIITFFSMYIPHANNFHIKESKRDCFTRNKTNCQKRSQDVVTRNCDHRSVPMPGST